MMSISVLGTDSQGKVVLLGEKEFNVGLYGGKTKQPAQLQLVGGQIQKN